MLSQPTHSLLHYGARVVFMVVNVALEARNGLLRVHDGAEGECNVEEELVFVVSTHCYSDSVHQMEVELMLDKHDDEERVNSLGFLLNPQHVIVLGDLDGDKLLELHLEIYFYVPQEVLVYVNILGAGVVLVLLEAD